MQTAGREQNVPKMMTFVLINLNEEEENQVLKHVGYSRSQLSRDVATLRQWLVNQEHLPLARLKEKDEFLVNFLVGCKGSLEKCKRKLDNYYTYRRKSILFAERNPKAESIEESRKNVLVAVMPKCLPNGYRLCFMKLLSSDGFDILTACRRIIISSEVRMRWPISAGDTVVVDCSDFSSSYLPALNPTTMREMLQYLQDALPLRCSQYYFINCSPLVDTVVNKMIRPFLRSRMAERFTVTREGKTFLHKLFPKEVLPIDYDGFGLSFDKCLEVFLNSYGEIYDGSDEDCVNNLRELTDESKRPKHSPALAEDGLFGLQGSIKVLELD